MYDDFQVMKIKTKFQDEGIRKRTISLEDQQKLKQGQEITTDEEDILKEFVKIIMVEILLVDTKVAPSILIDIVNNKSALIEQMIRNNLGKISGYKLLYRSIKNFIYSNPNCWNGIYNDIHNIA